MIMIEFYFKVSNARPDQQKHIRQELKLSGLGS